MSADLQGIETAIAAKLGTCQLELLAQACRPHPQWESYCWSVTYPFAPCPPGTVQVAGHPQALLAAKHCRL